MQYFPSKYLAFESIPWFNSLKFWSCLPILAVECECNGEKSGRAPSAVNLFEGGWNLKLSNVKGLSRFEEKKVTCLSAAKEFQSSLKLALMKLHHPISHFHLTCLCLCPYLYLYHLFYPCLCPSYHPFFCPSLSLSLSPPWSSSPPPHTHWAWEGHTHPQLQLWMVWAQWLWRVKGQQV